MCDLHELCEKVKEYIKKNDIYNAEKIINDSNDKYNEETEFIITKAKLLIDKHKFNEAIGLLDNIIIKEENNYEGYYTRGKINLNIGKIQEAYEDILQASKLNPKKYEIKEYLGKVLIDLRRFEEARNVLKEVYRYSKSDKNIGYFQSTNDYVIDEYEQKEELTNKEKLSLASSYYSISNGDEALKIIKEIDNLEESVEGLLLYFNILNCFKDYKKADIYIDKALKLDDTNPRCYLYKGISFEHMFRYEEAEEAFNKAIEINKDFEPAYNRLARILNKLGKYEESIKISEASLESNFDKEVTYNNIGISNYNLHNYDEAISAYNKAIKVYPQYLDSYLNKSRMYRDSERYREAMDCCNEAMDLGHKNEKIALEKAYILNEVEEYQDAVEWLDWAIDMEDKDIRLHALRGVCLCSLERYSEALEAMEEVLKLSPDNIMSDSCLLHVYYYMGNETMANDIYSKYNNYLEEMSKCRSELRDDKIYTILRNTVISCEQKLRRNN